MIDCPTVSKADIQHHYDWATPFYRLLWGVHIHHGLWDREASPKAAQSRLVEAMIERAGIERGQRVLDVGCGMGGSSIHLARAAGCDVTGITLSPVQRVWAATTARWQRVSGQVRFLRADAEKIEFPAASFDVVWSIECTEHLFDKPRFFRRAAEWLKPGGRMAICAWLAGSDDLSAEAAEQVRLVGEGFLCASLGSRREYGTWMSDAGLMSVSYDDWTDQIARTWEVCHERVERSGVRVIARRIRNMERFLDRFQMILDAYRRGLMRYGCFVYRKPS
ncbi:MAG TPA: methyltransferase domain-containing protein [Pirellulales bacterium]|jgi:tocopherol O-methyltransferase|nr:methyltransferase domain-containing protein [Pirellulales bacterium]